MFWLGFIGGYLLGGAMWTALFIIYLIRQARF